MNERVKHFKDSMGRKYSGSSTELFTSLMESGGGSDDDSCESSDLSESDPPKSETPRSNSVGGSEDERYGIELALVSHFSYKLSSPSSLPDSARGRRRFASMKVSADLAC